MRNILVKCSVVAFLLFAVAGCEEDTIDYDADFESSVNNIGVGQYVNFEDASTGGVTNWEWTFEGGEPSSSNEKEPSGILYANPGNFDVSLTITTDEGSSTETKEEFIKVEQLAGGCGSTTSVTDIDGNSYGVVTIGSQCWMTANLNVTKFRDGTGIPVVTDNSAWQNLESPGVTSYNNDNTNDATYGKLYNWYAVGDPRGICPEGWRVPHDNDYRILTDYLDPDGDFSGGRMKQTGSDLWESPNDGANNSSGFSGLPGGMRFREGMFDHIGRRGTFWTVREDGDFEAYFLTLTYDTPIAYRTRIFKQSGFSCRCIKE